MITGFDDRGIDLALLTFWAFLIFFAALIFYLHRENKREGYPLVEGSGDRRRRRVSIIGWPAPAAHQDLPSRQRRGRGRRRRSPRHPRHRRNADGEVPRRPADPDRQSPRRRCRPRSLCRAR